MAGLLLTALLVSTCSVAEVVVIVSAKSNITNLTIKQIAQIFLGKVSTFPDGSSATPLDQPEGSEIRNEFYTKVTRKDGAQLRAYWARIIFAGDGQPPRLESNSTSIKKAVADDPSGIGYIDHSLVDRTVKIVLIP